MSQQTKVVEAGFNFDVIVYNDADTALYITVPQAGVGITINSPMVQLMIGVGGAQQAVETFHDIAATAIFQHIGNDGELVKRAGLLKEIDGVIEPLDQSKTTGEWHPITGFAATLHERLNLTYFPDAITDLPPDMKAARESAEV